MSGGELYRVHPVCIFHEQLAGIVFRWVAEKERRRQVRANAVGSTRHLADGVVDVTAKGAAAFVPIEERGKHAKRKRGDMNTAFRCSAAWIAPPNSREAGWS